MWLISNSAHIVTETDVQFETLVFFHFSNRLNLLDKAVVLLTLRVGGEHLLCLASCWSLPWERSGRGRRGTLYCQITLKCKCNANHK
jgi:hypothetical protein